MGVKKTPFTQIKGRRILKQSGGIRKKAPSGLEKEGKRQNDQ